VRTTAACRTRPRVDRHGPDNPERIIPLAALDTVIPARGVREPIPATTNLVGFT
jgi:hypothetical protein